MNSIKKIAKIIIAKLEYKYGCVMIDVPRYINSYLLKDFLKDNLSLSQLNINEQMLGIETDSHITVLYGFVNTTEKEISIIRKLFNKKFNVQTGSKVEYFDNKDSSVVYVPIYSDELNELHSNLKKTIENVDKRDKYIPHLCLAYLKPGERLKSDLINKTFSFEVDFLVLSTTEGKTKIISKFQNEKDLQKLFY